VARLLESIQCFTARRSRPGRRALPLGFPPSARGHDSGCPRTPSLDASRPGWAPGALSRASSVDKAVAPLPVAQSSDPAGFPLSHR